MTTEENKLQILKKVEDGTLSIEEGADLLSMFDRVEETHSATAETGSMEVMDTPLEPLPTEVPAGWKALWSILIWLGVAAMGGSGYWLISSYQRSGLRWGFWFAFLFLAISTAIVYFGWKLVSGRWLGVRVHSTEEGTETRLKFWMPFPINLGLWAFDTFGEYIPAEVKEKRYDSILRDLDQSMEKNEVLVIDVDDNGSKNLKINMDF
jgi:hypothetical protein